MASPVRETGSHELTTASQLLENSWYDWLSMAWTFFKTLPPPPIPLLPADDAYDISKYKNKPTLLPAEASQKCADAIEKYDAEECKAHREEIDTLLVFAGLFSAVVTAFTIESYQWLQDDPNDAIVALLSHLADQPPPTTKGLPDAVSSRINAYWFLSLVLSLSSALVAIVCKQWVREFERHTGLSDATQFIGIRQMKLQGFEAWHVAGIVALIPLLLQSALGLFAVGVIELLWNLHRTVAIVVLIPTFASLLFYAFTTLMPAVQAFASPFRIFRGVSQCPFKSPQALLTLRLLVLIPIILRRFSALWKFLDRKCFVFCRRVHASSDTESSPERSETYDENPHSVLRRLPTVLPISSTLQLDNDVQFPVLEQTKSWLQVDQVFTASRDEAFTATECDEALNRGDTDTISPQFYFSGLSWLRDHVQKVGMESWIRMSIWDRINIFAHRGNNERHLSHLLFGINAACPSAVHRDYERHNLPNLALGYAQFMAMDDAFCTEFIIYHLRGITLTGWVDIILSRHLKADDESSHSFVHRILALDLDPGLIDHRQAVSIFKDYLKYCSPRAVPYQAMACLVALQLRALLGPMQDLNAWIAWNDPRFSDAGERRALVGSAFRELCMTLLLVTARLGIDRSDSRIPVSEREMSIFAASALVIDRFYEQLTLDCDGVHSFVMHASKLAQPENKAAYLDLLSAALGSRSLAEDHFQRTILRVTSRSPEPGQALEPGVFAHTAFDLPGSSVKPEDGAPSLASRDAELAAADAESSPAAPTGGNPAAAPGDDEPGPVATPAHGSGVTSAAAALAGAMTVARGDFDAHGPPAGLGLTVDELSPISTADVVDGEEQTPSQDSGAAVGRDDAAGQACAGELRPAVSLAPAMTPVALQDGQEPGETAAIDRAAM